MAGLDTLPDCLFSLICDLVTKDELPWTGFSPRLSPERLDELGEDEDDDPLDSDCDSNADSEDSESDSEDIAFEDHSEEWFNELEQEAYDLHDRHERPRYGCYGGAIRAMWAGARQSSPRHPPHFNRFAGESAVRSSKTRCRTK